MRCFPPPSPLNTGPSRVALIPTLIFVLVKETLVEWIRREAQILGFYSPNGLEDRVSLYKAIYSMFAASIKLDTAADKMLLVYSKASGLSIIRRKHMFT